MKNSRGNSDLMKWMTRFQIDGRRLLESWMDLWPELDLTTPAIQQEVNLRRQQHNAIQAALFCSEWSTCNGQMKWRKLSMMRLPGFTNQHIVIYSHSLKTWLHWYLSLQLIYHRIRDKAWQASWHTGIERWTNTEGLNWEKCLNWTLHSENSCGQSCDESIRIRWKKSIFSSWWRRTWRMAQKDF